MSWAVYHLGKRSDGEVNRRHALIVGAAALFLAASSYGVFAIRAATPGISGSAPLACNQFPTPAPRGTAPTPLVAPTPSGAFRSPAPQVTVVSGWASCFRPQVVTIRVGERVQWQQIGPYDRLDVVLDDGTSLGPIRMFLEVQFNRPGRYPYHAGSNRAVAGTVIVQGAALPGPALQIEGPPGTTRSVWRIP
jgi:plastocyanin